MFFGLEEWQNQYLQEKLKDQFEVKCCLENLTPQNAEKFGDADALGVFVFSPITAKTLDLFPHLKFITTLSTGFDHINLPGCKARNIVVSSVPSYGENTVAEHVFALILALSRKIVDSVERTRRGDFTLEGVRGFDLKGKTIGIIGGGRIGMHVVRIARGFEMNLLVSDVYQDPILAEREGFRYADLNGLLANSDVITLHAPYTPKTHHLINIRNIDRIKKGALLINTARGALIETDAILHALKGGILAGVGLDVLEEENVLREEEKFVCDSTIPQECNLQTVLQNHVLLNHPKVIVTPHNAFNSREALQRILDTTVENIEGFFAGKPLNVVQ